MNDLPYGAPEGSKPLSQIAKDISARNRDWQTGKLTTEGKAEIQSLYARDAGRRGQVLLAQAQQRLREMSPEKFQREAQIAELYRPRAL